MSAKTLGERLRGLSKLTDDELAIDLALEAADEIERLERELAVRDAANNILTRHDRFAPGTEFNRLAVAWLKLTFLNWRTPPVELPADSLIETVVMGIARQAANAAGDHAGKHD